MFSCSTRSRKVYIKALLVFYLTPFARTHDLPELVALLPTKSRVPAVAGDLTELTDAAVSARYPDESDEYDMLTARRLSDQARNVRKAVLDELKSYGYNVPIS